MTRSTGECMCHPKATCEGRNCESGQGMIWYSFKNCPSGCKCVPKDAPAEAAASAADPFAGGGGSEAVAQCEEDKPCEDDADGAEAASKSTPPKEDLRGRGSSVKPKAKAKAKEASKESEDDYDEYGDDDEYLERVMSEMSSEPAEPEMSSTELFLDFLDENGRFIFGGVVVLFVFCCFLPIFMMGVSGGGGGDEAAPAAPKAKAAGDEKKPPSPKKRTPK
eukprot:CAMPEP_0182580698 /NCGR_PEP_ID=MMETSP1324-20130603/47857_1 /TAXON_ID=236786 /ORGANISM="Florenciella sp., Strain RCC1587" /LENGTH=220 /DNA_ID=CAMNT_0024796969 /DNA_START=49 /DNA_END=708 /DNA_ORIENTATION=+